MVIRTIQQHHLAQMASDILDAMETGTLPCFYESQISMDDFIVQQVDFFISRLTVANQDAPSFQAS
jgi:hypothetical protein